MSRRPRLWRALAILAFFAFAFLCFLIPPDQLRLLPTRINQLDILCEWRISHWDWKDTAEEIQCRGLVETGSTKQEPRPPRIPNVVHFVYLGTRDQAAELSYGSFLAIKSALVRMRPDAVKMHVYTGNFNTSNPWWEALQDRVVLVEHDRDSVRGPNDQPPPDFIWHLQHEADFLRLAILWEEGGIYLDTDVFPLKPFTDLLHSPRDALLGHEGGNRYGLCNAVILARPKSEFIRKWVESYRSFDPRSWNYHSVRMPKLLQVENPSLICPLSPSVFFWPTWAVKHQEYMQVALESADAREFQEQLTMNDGAMYANQLAVHQRFRPTPGSRLLEDTRMNILLRDVVDAPII